MNSRHLMVQGLLLAAGLTAVAGVSASPMTYSGYDASVLKMADPHPNATAQKSLFTSMLITDSDETEGFNLGSNKIGDPQYLTEAGKSLWDNGQGTLKGTVCNANSQPTCHTELTQSRTQGGSATGRFDTSGTDANNFPSWWFETDQSFTVSFGGAYNAFGFYSTDAGDFGGTFTITLLNIDGSDASTICVTTANAAFAAQNPACQVVSGSSNGGLLFFGFTDAQSAGYSGIRFNIMQGADTGNGPDIIGFDDMVIGNVAQVSGNVPEPTSLALAALALLGAGAAARRQRQA
jgi:hypothetical protein